MAVNDPERTNCASNQAAAITFIEEESGHLEQVWSPLRPNLIKASVVGSIALQDCVTGRHRPMLERNNQIVDLA